MSIAAGGECWFWWWRRGPIAPFSGTSRAICRKGWRALERTRGDLGRAGARSLSLERLSPFVTRGIFTHQPRLNVKSCLKSYFPCGTAINPRAGLLASSNKRSKMSEWLNWCWFPWQLSSGWVTPGPIQSGHLKSSINNCIFSLRQSLLVV